jgi:general secretion pathway protein A
MYASYFAFRQEPFSIAPDPGFLYPGPQHRDALDQLLYGINKGGGMMLLTGEVGTGKTTLSRFLLSQLPADVEVLSLHNSKLDNTNTLQIVCTLLECPSGDHIQPYEAIQQALEKRHAAGKKTLLMVEEAQNLDLPVLETLRLLTNIETDTDKLLHVLLIGQPELVVTLNRPDMRQLAQRVVARYHLQPLSFEETTNYITHRLTLAGGQTDVFSKPAIKVLYNESGGIPRLINLIADRALLSVYQANGKQASAQQVRDAARVIKGAQLVQHQPIRQPIANLAWLYAIPAVLLLAVLAWLGWQYIPQATQTNDPATDKNPVSTETSVVPLPTEEPAATQPVAESVAEEANLESYLLALWGITTDGQALCATAEANGLACTRLAGLDNTVLLRYNRPALVSLSNKEQSQIALLLSADKDNYRLLTPSGEIQLSSLEFTFRWHGDALLLWRPPPGYRDSVRLGHHARQTVQWLQNVLNQLGMVEGKIITGGVYTQLLSEKVAEIQRESGLTVDGILGRQSIIAINSKIGSVPTLVPSQ